MFPVKSSPLACIRIDLMLTALIMFCLSPLTLFAQESKVDLANAACLNLLRLRSQSRSSNPTNVIAVLKITVTDNDNNVSRTSSSELPQDLSVQGNYPNPFRTRTNILFNLPLQAQGVRRGFRLTWPDRTIRPRRGGWMQAGIVHCHWILPQTSSGLYVYRINMETASGTLSRTGRIVRIR